MTSRTLFAACFLAALFPAAASAQRPRPGGHITGRSFTANKTFGLGLELGAPLGFTGKYFLAPDRALDFGVGDIYNYFNRSGLHVYGDYLFHPVSLASNESFELPFYIGVGARFWSFRDSGPTQADDAFAFGVRMPVGVAFDFNNQPVDLFIQVVPVLDFFSGYAAHSTYLDVDASIGVRYWFD